MFTDPTDEWHEWYHLAPLERWRESEKLWAQYLAQGGSLDPEPDSQSPFFDEREARESATSQVKLPLRVLRRGKI